MIAVEIKPHVFHKSRDLLSRPESWQWAACAALWARVLALASPGREKWPEFFDTVREAFSLAMLRCTNPEEFSRSESLIIRFDNFDIEDDGSAEWEFIVDFVTMIAPAVDGQDIGACLEIALRSYLEGIKNVLSNGYAAAYDGVIRYDDAMKQLAVDPEWSRAVDFIRAL